MDRYTDMQEGREGGRGGGGRETVRRSMECCYMYRLDSHGECVSPKTLSENYTWKICV